MDKEELRKIKKRLIALGILGVMLGTSGCQKVDENGVPLRTKIPDNYNSYSKYVDVVVRDGQVKRICKAENICLFYDKESFEVNEYIYDYAFKLLGEQFGGDLYDLETEELIFHNDGLGHSYNEKYLLYLVDNNYIVSLEKISNYIERLEPKEYYTLEEIKELEPQILESLKIIIDSKTKKL